MTNYDKMNRRQLVRELKERFPNINEEAMSDNDIVSLLTSSPSPNENSGDIDRRQLVEQFRTVAPKANPEDYSNDQIADYLKLYKNTMDDYIDINNTILTIDNAIIEKGNTPEHIMKGRLNIMKKINFTKNIKPSDSDEQVKSKLQSLKTELKNEQKKKRKMLQTTLTGAKPKKSKKEKASVKKKTLPPFDTLYLETLQEDFNTQYTLYKEMVNYARQYPDDELFQNEMKEVEAEMIATQKEIALEKQEKKVYERFLNSKQQKLQPKKSKLPPQPELDLEECDEDEFQNVFFRCFEQVKDDLQKKYDGIWKLNGTKRRHHFRDFFKLEADGYDDIAFVRVEDYHDHLLERCVEESGCNNEYSALYVDHSQAFMRELFEDYQRRKSELQIDKKERRLLQNAIDALDEEKYIPSVKYVRDKLGDDIGDQYQTAMEDLEKVNFVPSKIWDTEEAERVSHIKVLNKKGKKVNKYSAPPTTKKTIERLIGQMTLLAKTLTPPHDQYDE